MKIFINIAVLSIQKGKISILLEKKQEGCSLCKGELTGKIENTIYSIVRNSIEFSDVYAEQLPSISSDDRTLHLIYLLVVRNEEIERREAKCFWCSLDTLHNEPLLIEKNILNSILNRISEKDFSLMPHFLPKLFTIEQLRLTINQVFDYDLPWSTLQYRISKEKLPIVKVKQKQKVFRPAQLYKFSLL